MLTKKGYTLQWEDHNRNASNILRKIRSEVDFQDVTLACSDSNGQVLRGHKVVLASSSSVFKEMLQQQGLNLSASNTSLFLRGIPYRDLSYLMDFIYQGEINIPEDYLPSFMSVAEDLKIKGLGFEKQREKLESNSQLINGMEDNDYFERPSFKKEKLNWAETKSQQESRVIKNRIQALQSSYYNSIDNALLQNNYIDSIEDIDLKTQDDGFFTDETASKMQGLQDEVIDINFSEEKDRLDLSSPEENMTLPPLINTSLVPRNPRDPGAPLFPKNYREFTSSDKTPSAVWSFFDVNPDEDHLAVCNIKECKGNSRKVSRGNEKTGKRSWSTKGMWGHLRRYHEEEHAAIYHMKQTAIKKENH